MRVFLIALLLGSTLSLSAQLNCPYGTHKGPAGEKYVLFGGAKWDCDNVTYFLENGPSSFSTFAAHQAVRRALATWETASNVRFFEVCGAGDADIVVRWADLESDDDQILGGTGCPPPPANQDFQNCQRAGLVTLNDNESWWTSGNSTLDLDIETIVLHEIGHALGIDHTNRTGTTIVMQENLQPGQLHRLHWDDRAAMRRLYGSMSDSEIGGATTVYANQYPFRSAYSLDCIPAGYSVQWAADFPLSIAFGQGQQYVHVNVPRSLSSDRTTRVRATLTGPCGQTRTFVKTIRIIRPTSGGGSSCTLCPQPLTGGGESYVDEPVFHLQPNPVAAGDQLLLRSDRPVAGRYEIVSVTGRLVGEGVLASGGATVIPTADLRPGAYLLRQLPVGGSAPTVQRFIVR